MAGVRRGGAVLWRALTSSAGLLVLLLIVLSAGVLPLVRTDAGVSAAGCPAVTAPRLSGAFIRPDVGPTPASGPWWGSADWQGLLGVLHQDCLDQVVLQWTAQTWSGPTPPPGVADPAWPGEPVPACVQADVSGRYVQPLYPAADPVWAGNAAQPLAGSCGAVADRETDQVGQLLSAARDAGIKVWLGLQIDEQPWFGTGNSDPTWLLGANYPAQVGGQALLSQQLAADLWTRYGPGGAAGDFSATIAGFYIPFEADNEYFPTGSPAMTDYGDYLGAVTDAIHHLPGGRRLGVMIAPVQHSQIGAPATDPAQQQLRANWTSTLYDWLSESGVTVLAPQDATGMQTTSPADLGAWALAARQAVDQLPNGVNNDGLPVQLWGDAEIYSVQGVADMSLDRLLGDLAATNSAGADVQTFVAFSAANLDDTPGHPNAVLNSIYHRAYLRYLDTGALPAQTVDPPAPLGGATPPTRLAAVLTDGNGMTVGLRWSVSPSGSTHPAAGASDALTWPVTGYQVFRDGQPIAQLPQPFTDRLDVSGFPVPDTTTNGGLLGFSDAGLQPGRDYDYQVAAFDPFGNLSPLTNAVRVTVPVDAGAASIGPGGSVDVAVHAPYAITDTSVDPSRLTDGSADPPPVADHLVPPNGAYPDSTPAPDLDDGVVGGPDYLDPAWSWQPTSAGTFTITTDLGQLRPVNTIRSAWLNQTSEAIAPPTAIAVSYATTDSPVDADWHPFGDTVGAGLPAEGPNPATPAEVAITDPGVGWLTTALPSGVTESARWIRLTVTVPPTARWTLVSQEEILGPAGNRTAAKAGITAAGAENFTRPAGCPGVAGCPRISISGNAQPGAGSWWPRRGLLTSGEAISASDAAAPEGRFLGWCFPASADCATPSGGNAPVGQFAITVDLGSNQAVGSLVTAWDAPAEVGNVELPAAVSYAYRTAADGTHADSGWVSAGVSATPVPDGAVDDFTVYVPPSAKTGAPVDARWVRVVVSLPSAAGWVLAGAVHVYTPPVVTLTQEQAPLVYPTTATVNYAFDPGQPVDPDRNNPTTPLPNGSPPPLPVDASGQAVAALCSADPGATPCRATDPAPVLANVLTGIDPSTGAPYRGDAENWWAPASHWVALSGAAGYDIVVPTPDAPAALTELRAHFLQDNGAAIGLPHTVDYYVTTTPNPTANPQQDTWIWTRDTGQRPNLPPYLPDAAILTWTYTSTVPRTAAPITAIRIHVNTYRGQQIFLDRLGAYAWVTQ